MTNMFSLDLTNVKGALMSGALAAIVGMLIYIATTGDVFAIQIHPLVNAFVLPFVTALIASLGKNYVTGSDGKALGVQVK